MKCVALLGNPVSHSRSPGMHNAALAELGLDWQYLAFAVTADQLAEAVAGLWALGFEGFNVTIPHKERVIPLLAGVSTSAKSVGAVNTVCRTPAGWWGTNTDVAGFQAGLSEVGRGHTLVLGSGGAARAVLSGISGEIYVLGRNQTALNELAQAFTIQPLTQLTPEILRHCALVVNCTPLGMTGSQVDQTPLSSAELALLPADALIYDLVYTPEVTLLRQLAQDRGLRTVGGLGMLVEQGALALALWTGQQPSRATMWAAAQAGLG